jgi:cytochrome P450
VRAEEEGSRLSNDELTANIILLFGAGHETTVNLIGNGLLALYRHPDQLRLLRDDPSLITNAVEEFLRYDSSVQLTGRVALEDTTVGGTDPDRLDITRPNIRPLSFGGGIHFCLGAQLARIEAEIAIATLLRRLPGLTLDDPEHPAWRPTFVLRGLKHLSASW